VTLSSILENIFFKYHVNKFERPGSKLYVFENIMKIRNLIIRGFVGRVGLLDVYKKISFDRKP
jgi:hypothetical protein